jgi:hypothetical protein
VAPGVYAYSSSLAVDDDGSDPDPDPDHQGETTFQDSNGVQLAAHHVLFYVLGDDCWDQTTPCPHFFYEEHGISGRQFALMFYNGKVIGAIFGDTQTGNSQTTSDNDSRELGEASVKSASLLGIPSSGTRRRKRHPGRRHHRHPTAHTAPAPRSSASSRRAAPPPSPTSPNPQTARTP